MSLISRLLSSLFPKTEYRILILALDAAGKTSILYQLKLGEAITTIPTIGFNVETISYKGSDITMWDVGGCDKIHPLWRHYFHNTQALFFVVDSNDRDRMGGRDDQRPWTATAYGVLHTLLTENELRGIPILVYANKQDLPNCLSASEVANILELEHIQSREVGCFSCCGISGDGIHEGLDWLLTVLKSSKVAKEGSQDTAMSDEKTNEKNEEHELTEEQKMEALLTEWLSREDDEDDIFLEKLDNFSLESWDHRTHLRIAFVLLSRYGRREGMKQIFDRIKLFIDNSPRTQRSKGTTFHETMTYFWVHMVHYSMSSSSLPNIDPEAAKDFKIFLLMNPVLVNGGLFLHYYSKKRMLLDPEARVTVLLPDKHPLPSLLTDISNKQPVVNLQDRLTPRAPLTDEEFLQHLESRSLTGWGHEAKLRAIFLLLRVHGRSSGGVDKVLESLRDIEQENAHLTLNYFWIQMITYHVAVELKHQTSMTTGIEKLSLSADQTLTFAQFLSRPHCQQLRNPLLYEKYYSRSVIDDISSAQSFSLPNLKQIPTKLP